MDANFLYPPRGSLDAQRLEELQSEFPRDWPKAFLCYLSIAAHIMESPVKNRWILNKKRMCNDLQVKAKSLDSYLVVFSKWECKQNQITTKTPGGDLEITWKTIVKHNQSKTNAENRRKIRKSRSAVPKGRSKEKQRAAKGEGKPALKKGSTRAPVRSSSLNINNNKEKEKKIEPKEVDLAPNGSQLVLSGSDTKATEKRKGNLVINKGRRSMREFTAGEAEKLKGTEKE